MKFEPARNGRSARVTEYSNTDVLADEIVLPLRDNIFVEPLNVVLSKYIIVKEETKPLRGIVKAVGPGHYPIVYDHPDKASRTKCWQSTEFEPTTLKAGDIVELGGYDYQGYSFPSVYWDGKLHLICREADVTGIDTTMSADEARNKHEAMTI